MKPGMKPNIIRGVLRRAKEKNETGGEATRRGRLSLPETCSGGGGNDDEAQTSCGDGGSSEHVTGGS